VSSSSSKQDYSEVGKMSAGGLAALDLAGNCTTEVNFPPRPTRLRARDPLRALEGDGGAGCGVP
jgi:hypothetical protein